MEPEVAAQLLEYNRLYKEMDEIYHDYAKACGLSDTAVWVLYTICENTKEYTQAELCSLWSYSRQTVNSALKSLESQGVLQLVAAPESRKNKLIRLTAEGKRLVEQKIMPLLEADRKSFGELDAVERGIFLALNRKYVKALRNQTKLAKQKSKGESCP